ncbi:hypothetical protein [Streptomyces sp. STR69]|uniref:hypothetical protein n=1 Tax=Streptomyces sp. STR69 TaxID=1796942 RepID=UPI0021C6E567|nr:hypothetical protein [Streptomyces sp. STR69]
MRDDDQEEGPLVMALTLTAPLSGALHELLTARSLRERNREIVFALVAAGNRGEVNHLTRHWAGAAGTGGRTLPDGLGLTVESVIADHDVVALRATARAEGAAWSLVAELHFDAAGRIERCQDLLVPQTPAS